MSRITHRGISAAVSSRLFQRLLGYLDTQESSCGGLLRVLAYHRVDYPDARPDLSPQLISATPDEFDRQLALLAERYRVVSVQDVICFVRAREPLPRRSVLITFDDAYQDFAEHAWPVLQRYRMPATLFVPTAFPGRPGVGFWWDRLYQAYCLAQQRPAESLSRETRAHFRRSFRQLRAYVKSLPADTAEDMVDWWCRELEVPPPPNPVLSWQALRRLARGGVTLCPHTRTHPLLTRVPLERARDEVLGSYDDLERAVGPVPKVFAFPNGSYSDDVLRILRGAGFLLAFTTCRGTNDLWTADLLQLRRIPVGRNTTTPLLRAQMVPWASALGTTLPSSRTTVGGHETGSIG